MELVTLNLVQDYLEAFTRKYPDILVTYQYPFMVSSLAHQDLPGFGSSQDSGNVGAMRSHEGFTEW